MSWFSRRNEPLGEQQIGREGNPVAKMPLTASEARMQAERNAVKYDFKRRSELMYSIENYYVKYGHTEARFHSPKSKYCLYGQNLDERDISYLENLGYKVELRTEPHEYFTHGGAGPIQTEVTYYNVSW